MAKTTSTKSSSTKTATGSQVLRNGSNGKSAAASALSQADKKTKAEHAAKGRAHLERAWAKLTQAK